MKWVTGNQAKWTLWVTGGIAILGAQFAFSFLLLVAYLYAVQHKQSGLFFVLIMIVFLLQAIGGIILALSCRRTMKVLSHLPPPATIEHSIEQLLARVEKLRANPGRVSSPEEELDAADLIERSTELLKLMREMHAERQRVTVGA